MRDKDISSNKYGKLEALSYEGKNDNPNDGGNIWLYRSKINAITTEPGRDSTFDRWWEPVRLY